MMSYVERVNRAIDLIVSRPDALLRLKDLSRAARLSPYHFHRVFQALVGETPGDFVKRLRLEKALSRMTLSRPPSLTSIALQCGFSSSSDFSRSFKQRFGVPPSAFDCQAWRKAHAEELESKIPISAGSQQVKRLPVRDNPDKFVARIRELPTRSVAYTCVTRPYEGDRVMRSVRRLISWAERERLADSQWLGYQWDNPEIASLDDCRYYVAVEAERFIAKGEIGRFRFPPMTVAEVHIQGDIHLELRALQWLYGAWLPRSGFLPDDHPGFEAWIGRPFAHGTEHFDIHIQLPIRR